jgi:hypothetical protein
MRMGLSATAAFATNYDCVASVVAACIACSPSAPRDRIFGEGQGPVPDADVPLAPILLGDAAGVGSLRSLLTRRSRHPGRLFACRLKARLRRFLRAWPQYAVERPGDRACGEDREPRAEPNGNSHDRYGPSWEIVHGAMSPRHTNPRRYFPRNGYWIVDRRLASPRSDREWACGRPRHPGAGFSLGRRATAHVQSGPLSCGRIRSFRNRNPPIAPAATITKSAGTLPSFRKAD